MLIISVALTRSMLHHSNALTRDTGASIGEKERIVKHSYRAFQCKTVPIIRL